MGNARFTLAATSVVLAGCSLLLDTSDANAPAPAPRPFVPTPSFEAGVDSSVGDAGAPADGSTAPTDDGGGDAGLDCADTVNDDFDTAALGARWDAVNPQTATIAIDSADAFSKPSSLLVTLPATPESSGSLAKNVPGAKSVCCQMRVRLPTEHVRFLELMGRAADYRVYAAISQSQMSMGEVLSSSSSPINRGAGSWQTDGAWRHVRFEAKLPAGAGIGTLKIHVDGMLAIDTTLGHASEDLTFDKITLGAPYAQVPSGGTVRFDDVRCSAK